MITRACSDCGEILPFDEDHFVRGHTVTGLGCRCLPCGRKKVNAYRAANLEAARARVRKHHQAHKDDPAYMQRRREGFRRWYQDHREEQIKRASAFYWNDHERALAANRASKAAHREENREKDRIRRAENPEKNSAQQRKYRKEHPEMHRAQEARRRAVKMGAEGSHTAEDIEAQYARQKGRCYWCKDKLGRYHVDHVVPLCLGGSNGPENLVIACPTCNCKKHTKHPMEFAGVML